MTQDEHFAKAWTERGYTVLTKSESNNVALMVNFIRQLEKNWIKLPCCELIECLSDKKDRRLISVNENLGDESYNVSICKTCAKALNMKKGMDLPDANEVTRMLNLNLHDKQHDRRN